MPETPLQTWRSTAVGNRTGERLAPDAYYVHVLLRDSELVAASAWH